MAHPKLVVASNRTLLTAGATIALMTLPVATVAGAADLNTAEGAAPPAAAAEAEPAAVEEGTAAAQEAAAAPAQAAAATAPEAPAPAPVQEPAPAPVQAAPATVSAGESAAPAGGGDAADVTDPIDDLTEMVEQAVTTVQGTVATVEETVGDLVGSPPVEPPPGAPAPGDVLPGAPPADDDGAPSAPRGSSRDVVAPAGGPVTPLSGPTTVTTTAPALPDSSGGTSIGPFSLGGGASLFLPSLPAPVISLPFATEVPEIAEQMLAEDDATAVDGPVAATPIPGVVPGGAPAWLLTTAAGLLLLVGAAHVARIKAQPA